MVGGPGPGADHTLGKYLLDQVSDGKKRQTIIGEEGILANLRDPEASEEKTGISNCVTIQRFCMAKDTINKINRQLEISCNTVALQKPQDS